MSPPHFVPSCPTGLLLSEGMLVFKCLAPMLPSTILSLTSSECSLRMYNKLISGKPGKRAVLDAIKMQRLTELGFQFRPRGSYESWDDQIEKLQRFKEEHGHCRVPVSHPVLGNFVKLARREYKLKQQGSKSSMTADRERDLREIGFVFEGGKTPQRREAMNKSWEERFQELLYVFICIFLSQFSRL